MKNNVQFMAKAKKQKPKPKTKKSQNKTKKQIENNQKVLKKAKG